MFVVQYQSSSINQVYFERAPLWLKYPYDIQLKKIFSLKYCMWALVGGETNMVGFQPENFLL